MSKYLLVEKRERINILFPLLISYENNKKVVCVYTAQRWRQCNFYECVLLTRTGQLTITFFDFDSQANVLNAFFFS